MTALIWHKNFGYCLLGKTAAPSIKPKLWKSLAALFVEIFSKKILGGGFRPIWVTQWQEFEIFPQKWRFQIFQVALLSRWLQWFLASMKRIKTNLVDIKIFVTSTHGLIYIVLVVFQFYFMFQHYIFFPCQSLFEQKCKVQLLCY